ncbi:SIR2 family NAD-dependent protein deacylase [Peribacillus sp. NPDC097206]|uniref:SIR2 family NAD-dependent protein deacylase n=1 Tax=unclassified Peribacillus TaxID=2675266 RepID=UPI00380FE6D3
MQNKNIEEYFKNNLNMFRHLEMIRDNLWSKDGKSRVSVMVGAGFSLNASKIDDNFKGMALWDDLKNILVKKLSHHVDIEEKDILEISEIYEDEYGRASLDEILKEAIPDDNYQPDDLHYNFLNLPWADVYTTNYDTLLERTKKKVYERKYQVIYDMNDIPNSVSPRIIKLHGSFPSNRPFIFSKKDYENYPKTFSPFVNMVQQSIMETTFVLIGFSGDDPNFEKWITWVKENLGEHMPKIYMIGYDQEKRTKYLKLKGITLIDFKKLYCGEKNPYAAMFLDLFEFLNFKNREEKTKWPFKTYNKFKIPLEDLKYNRENFPGWVVLPNHIRRSSVDNIRRFGNEKILSLKDVKSGQNLSYIKELLWCYKIFYIPLEYTVQNHLQMLINEIEDINSRDLYMIVWFLINSARLDCNKDDFYKYKALLENCELNNSQKNEIVYEEILLHLVFNDIEFVKTALNEWEVRESDIEWRIKKANLLLSVNEEEKAHSILENVLQLIRSLLAIQEDDYRLLSLESIALYHLGIINKGSNYSYDRLRVLNIKNCNVNQESEQIMISIKSYRNDLGTKKIPGFDPGKERISSKVGDYFKKELLDSYALLCIKEWYRSPLVDKQQYLLALENLDILYPIYSLMKRIQIVDLKEIHNIFSREYVYLIEKEKLTILVDILKTSLKQKEYPILKEELVLEIVSRVYFALSRTEKLEIDDQVIHFLEKQEHFRNNDELKKVLETLLERIAFDKNKQDRKSFFEKLLDLQLYKQWQQDKTFYKNNFFEPFLTLLSFANDITELDIKESKLIEMLNLLKESEDLSIREASLIRMTFLSKTKSLLAVYQRRFVEILITLPKTNSQGISEFIYSHVFDELINSDKDISSNAIDSFLKKDIPTFYKKGVYSSGTSIPNYFQEIQGLFPDYIGIKNKKRPDSKYYKIWLENFFKWWEDQEVGLLRDINEDIGFLPLPDYLKFVVVCLKNNILSVAPLNTFQAQDYEKLKEIFEKIDNKRNDLSFLLIPSFEKLQIQIRYSITDIINSLKSKDLNAVKQALHCVYDYCVLMNPDQDRMKINIVKQELFSMLYYSTGKTFGQVIENLKYILKNCPNIFTQEEYQSLQLFINEYLVLIEGEKISFNTLEDFNLISNIAGFVTYLNKASNSSLDLKAWISYIESHRLPEVRKYSDIWYNQ